jgi:hypothetical protein
LMMRSTLALALVLSSVAAPIAAADLSVATARRGCTEEDLPAVLIFLSSEHPRSDSFPPKPFIKIEIATTNLFSLKGQELALIPLNRNEGPQGKRVVRAQWQSTESAKPIWLYGNMHIEDVDAAQRIRATYKFRGPSDEQLEGRFDAQWQSVASVCG